MMTVQSDRYTKPVFLDFLLTVFGFGFFQEPPQPTWWSYFSFEKERLIGQKFSN